MSPKIKRKGAVPRDVASKGEMFLMPDEGFSVYSDFTKQPSEIAIVGKNKPFSSIDLDSKRGGLPTFADKV